MNTAKNGFTIVELLIVIVVIGILAALSYVTYSGFQTKARNSTKVSIIQQTMKLIHLYKAENGNYPLSSAMGDFCLTTDNLCTNYAGTPHAASNSVLMDALKAYGTPASQSGDQITAGSRYGITYSYTPTRTLESQTNPLLLMFFLEGTNQMCAGLVTGMISVADSVNPENFAPANRSSGNAGGKTRCYMMFPNS